MLAPITMPAPAAVRTIWPRRTRTTAAVSATGASTDGFARRRLDDQRHEEVAGRPFVSAGVRRRRWALLVGRRGQRRGSRSGRGPLLRPFELHVGARRGAAEVGLGAGAGAVVPHVPEAEPHAEEDEAEGELGMLRRVERRRDGARRPRRVGRRVTDAERRDAPVPAGSSLAQRDDAGISCRRARGRPCPPRWLLLDDLGPRARAGGRVEHQLEVRGRLVDGVPGEPVRQVVETAEAEGAEVGRVRAAPATSGACARRRRRPGSCCRRSPATGRRRTSSRTARSSPR